MNLPHTRSLARVLLPAAIAQLAACGQVVGWPLPDNTPPEVVSTTPEDLTVGAPRYAPITATFSEALDPITVTDASFFLKHGAEVIPAMSVYAGLTALLVPATELDAETTYEVTASTGLTDVAGNPLAEDYRWTFTTGALLDTTIPFVIATAPRSSEAGVATNGLISATFSEPMAPGSLRASTFTLTGPGAVSVPGAVSYDVFGPTSTFTPAADLIAGTTYTATVTTGATDLGGNALADDYVWTFTTLNAPDTSAPFVVLTNPDDDARNVVPGAHVLALFNEPMDPATLTGATFGITGPGNTAVAGVVTADPLSPIAVFAPATPLLPDVTYTGTVRTGATDVAGNHLAAPYVWTFQVTPAADTTPPFVILTNPLPDAVGVSDTVTLYAAFSEPMAPASLSSTTFVLTDAAGVDLAASVVYNGPTPIALLTPAAPLAFDAEYSVAVTTNATDLAGNHLASDYVWTFHTALRDVTPPEVILTSPVEGLTTAALDVAIFAAFSEPMNPATITGATFGVKGPGNADVPGVVQYRGGTAVAEFLPAAPLLPGTIYIATITAAASDVAGNTMVNDYAWTFRTVGADTTRPFVTLTNPAANTTGVPLDVVVLAAFSEPMNPGTVTDTTFLLTGPGAAPIAGTVSILGLTAMFSPDAPLSTSVDYTATITTTAADLAGNQLAAPYSWTFRTLSPLDAEAPRVVLTNPDDGASDVASDADLLVAFSETMDAASVSTSTFTVQGPGLTDVPGTVSYSFVSPIAIFLPDSPLLDGVTYTATITTGATDLAGNALAADYVWQFTTAAPGDSTAPVVVLTFPADGATNVATDTLVLASFNEPMDPGSFGGGNVALDCDGPVAGVITFVELTAIVTFTPDAPLPPGTTCTATLDGMTDLAGNALVGPYAWTFTTAAAPDTTAPFVLFTSPLDQSLQVPVDAIQIAAFNEPMDSASVLVSFSLVDADLLPVSGSTSFDGAFTATFVPDASLLSATTYTATISAAASDLAGNPMLTDYSWTFTTAIALDDGPPFVTLTLPLDGAIDVPVTTRVSAMFSEAMDGMTFDPLSMQLDVSGGASVPGSVLYEGWSPVGIFTPDAELLPGTTYTATVSGMVTDVAGNPLGLDYVWTFTTAADAYALMPIDLGSLTTFVAVAGAGLTNSNSAGVTTLNGDVGLSPTGTCMGDGAPCTLLNPVINGTLYANDPEGIASRAKTDLTAAYVDGMSRPVGTIVNDLSELILPPGVYTSASTMSIAVGGTVYLDAQGDPNAVWIFQVGSSLTVNNNAQILLLNGARAKNVFWTVFASSTLGGSVHFQGTVLAGASNSVGTGSSVVGRLLCVTGQITLLGNDITLPPL